MMYSVQAGETLVSAEVPLTHRQLMNTAPSSSQNIDYEAVVKAVTEQVCKELGLSA